MYSIASTADLKVGPSASLPLYLDFCYLALLGAATFFE
jgi:hypothetical protein